MYGYMLFSHIVGLSVWISALIAIVIMLLMLRASLQSYDFKGLAKKVIRVFSALVYPSSIVVLVSGIIMVVEMNFAKGTKPLWLDVMEKGGGTLVMLAIVITAVLGRRLTKRLSLDNGQTIGISSYITSMIAFIIAILAIVLIVSLRIV